MLAAPNRFIRDFVAEKYSSMINAYLLDVVAPASAQVSVVVVGAAVEPAVTRAGVRHRQPCERRHRRQLSALKLPAALPRPGCSPRLTWLKATPSSVLSKAKVISLRWLLLNRWPSIPGCPITRCFSTGASG